MGEITAFPFTTVKGSELPAATALDAADTLSVTQSGTTKKATVALLFDDVRAGDVTASGQVIVKSDGVFDVRGYTGWDPIAANNDAAFTAALSAAATAGGTVLLPPLLQIAINHLVDDGVTLKGSGTSATPAKAASQVKCVAAGARLSFGTVDAARNGGASQDFLVNGNNLATNPVFVGVDVGRTFVSVDIIDSIDANLILQGTQNCTFVEVNCQGGPDQIRLERGCMSNLFLRCEFNDSSRYHCHIRAGGTAPGPVGSNLPSYNHFLRCIFERAAVGSVHALLHEAGQYNTIDSCVIADGPEPTPTLVKISKPGVEISHGLIFTGDVTIQRNISPPVSSVALDLGDNTQTYNNGTLHLVGTYAGIKHNTSGYLHNSGSINLASVTTATDGPAFYADLLIRQRYEFPTQWVRPLAENALQVRGPADANWRMTILGTGDIYRGNGTAAPVKVLGTQGASVANAAGGATVDTEARAALNALLARLRDHGLIAT